MPRFAVPELPLDHDQRKTFVGHLDGVRVPQLMGGELTSYTRRGGRMMQLFARG